MSAQKIDIKIEQGATYRAMLTYYETDIESPVRDLTGCVARMQVRKSQQSPVLLDASSANGKLVLGGTAGTILLNFSAADTNALTSKSALYDLELEFPDGRVDRLLQGSILVDPNITQAQGEVVVG